FSEDIDLTYITDDELNPRQNEKGLKKLEAALIGDLRSDKIIDERTPHSKSSFVYFGEDIDDKIKLEIGSKVRPDPITTKKMKTYIQECLEFYGHKDDVIKFGLSEITVNTLSIERTFIDKVFAVRRHAIVGSLSKKVRHVYDVVKLYELDEVQEFLTDREKFKRIVALAKKTDYYFLENRRPDAEPYNSMEPFEFKSWKNKFDGNIKKEYENLHTFLLYTDELQPFSKALEVFDLIDNLMFEINE
ncbi:MAG: nucleotidyl transferase AbiEii/AbiGii toxin family protein, partial [Peptostreptococcaceae bacterium]|nr:nucleotidyl transferase AbiEii/AbiGii toxin family protein [Peptostreptococcaceae bacterium]